MHKMSSLRSSKKGSIAFVMQRIGNIIKGFIKDYSLEGGLTFQKLKNQWPNLVGQTIASHALPDIIKGKTIFITVDTPQWMHHLNFYKQEILEKLKDYKIENVRFKIGKLPERIDTKQEINSFSLNAEDFKYIEDTIKDIRDEELKERFRKLLKKMFAYNRRVK